MFVIRCKDQFLQRNNKYLNVITWMEFNTENYSLITFPTYTHAVIFLNHNHGFVKTSEENGYIFPPVLLHDISNTSYDNPVADIIIEIVEIKFDIVASIPYHVEIKEDSSDE